MKRWERIAIAALSRWKGPDGKAFDLTHTGTETCWKLLEGMLTEEEKHALNNAVEILCKGKGPDGKLLDLKKLDSGRKCIADLLDEVRGRDVRLALHELTGRVIRIARTARILVTADGYMLLEYKRRYRNGDVVKKRQSWSVSETTKIHETQLQAAVRGIWEECKYRLSPELIAAIHYSAEYEKPHEHESTVYDGILSQVFTQQFDLKLPKLLWENGTEAEDQGMIVYTKWFKISEQSRQHDPGYNFYTEQVRKVKKFVQPPSPASSRGFFMAKP